MNLINAEQRQPDYQNIFADSISRPLKSFYFVPLWEWLDKL